MTVGTFKGRITPLNLAEILKFLKESGKTGLLKVEIDASARGLYVRRGAIIAVESTVPAESLVRMLSDAGRITPGQTAACASLVAGGVRPGRALVETGAITPAGLAEWNESRARLVLRSVLAASSGAFAFEEGALPPANWMLVDLEILQSILGVLRDLGDESLMASRLPEPEAVFELFTYSEGGEAPSLLPHEKYVLSLVNGKRSASEIARMSDLGEAATRRILCLMFLVGCVRHRRDETVEGAPLPEEDSISDVRSVIRAYNEMFAFIYAYMMKEVGPIAEHVLDKYLKEVRDSNSALLNRIVLGKDGTLNEDALARNVHLIRGRSRRDLLVGGLNEFLYSGLLAVKRTLGADHEAIVVRRLREMRRNPPPA